MNIDSSATAINIKKETEVKSEPKSDTSDNNMVGGANTGNAILPPISVANQANPGSTEVKQESSDAANVANHSNNDVSLNDFELDLENTDFQVCKISLYFFVTHTHRLTRDTLELTKLCSKVGRSFITLSYFAQNKNAILPYRISSRTSLISIQTCWILSSMTRMTSMI